MRRVITNLQIINRKALVLVTLNLGFMAILTFNSRIAADDYCNAWKTYELGFFGSIQKNFEDSPFITSLLLVSSNFVLVNQLSAQLSAVYLVVAYTLLFTVIAILTRLIVNRNFDLSFILGMVLLLLILLVISGQGTNAGGYLYGISWQGASVFHLLPGFLIIISILYWIQLPELLIHRHSSLVFFLVGLSLTLIIGNLHFMWSSSYFLVLIYIYLKVRKSYEYKYISHYLFTYLLVLLLNLILLFYIQITSKRYIDVGRDLIDVRSTLLTFLNILINNFWTIINNYSVFIAFLLGLIFYTFYKIKIYFYDFKIIFFIKTLLVFIFSSLLMVSLGEVFSYQASHHLLASVFVFNFVAFLFGWITANFLESILNLRILFFTAYLPVAFSLFIVWDGAISRLEKWNEYEAAPYGAMTDLDSGWARNCSDEIAMLPINRRP